jgi:hypothetical protein
MSPQSGFFDMSTNSVATARKTDAAFAKKLYTRRVGQRWPSGDERRDFVGGGATTIHRARRPGPGDLGARAGE